MEAVIFMGIQASGKSTYYLQNYFQTHVRISLDLLRTRYRENKLLQFCLETNQPFVIDNTNPKTSDRERYISLAIEKNFRVKGYYFQSNVTESLKRNNSRARSVPEVAILSCRKHFEFPKPEEGFDRLFYVSMNKKGFVTEDWNNEI